MGFLKKLFPKRVNVYIATSEDDYFRIANRLENNGISFRTKSPVNLSGPTPLYSSRETQISFYEIYVKVEDEYRAMQVIHQTQ